MTKDTSNTPFAAVGVVDSHTEGEPTRVVVSGGPDLGSGTVAEQLAVFRERFDWFRSAVVNEPRGSEAMVGALLCAARNPKAAAGVIFFNNVGYLHMCVHGTIGLGATLSHLGRIGPGAHLIETPVGDVTIHLAEDGGMAVENVASRRLRERVRLEVPELGVVHGDIAWGGNWFLLVDDHGLELRADRLEQLTRAAGAIRRACEAMGLKGDDGRAIDHVELFGPPTRGDCRSKNFVLCPGGAYDRSPCGTGTSAKLACLHADGKLRAGEVWRQESIIGSAFSGWVREAAGGGVIPTISGGAWITSEATLLIDPRDPFGHGIRVASAPA